MVFRETGAAYSENYDKYINTRYKQNKEPF
jgi:hypothetical protein